MEIQTLQDAKKQPLGPDDLPALFQGKTRLLVAKGKRLLDRKLQELSRDELLQLVIGPSGKLRAPTLIRGSKIMVGFSEDGCAAFLKR